MENRDNINEKEDDLEFDPTKEAFFSDLENEEQEIISEAYELVEHALSLIESKYYDDAIEVLRQALGLYSQINKLAEIEALNNKITEIYLLKEQDFQELQLKGVDETKTSEVEQTDEKYYNEIYTRADQLILEGLKLVNSAQYDEALLMYREAITLLQQINRVSEIGKVNELIEDCFIRKADFIKQEQDQVGLQPTTTTESELKTQKVHEFEELKRKERETSTKAYEILGKATELSNIHQYSDAIKMYREGAQLFEEINWINEVKKINTIIDKVEKEKEKAIAESEKIRVEQEKLKELEARKQEELIHEAKVQEELKIKAKMEKVREAALKKEEEVQFRIVLRSMIDYAEKLAREYDLEMKKLIKKGKLVENCIYPEVIKIYEDVKGRVDERGWKDQSEIYSRQIRHYQQLLDKDNKLRQFETEKRKKETEFEESLKVKKKIESTEVDLELQKKLEIERLNEQESLIQKKNLDTLIKNAERIARDYDVKFKKAVKDGNLDIESKYPQVIEIYTNAKNVAQDKGWVEDIAVYSSQIKKYEDLFDKEKKVRELEAKKATEKKLFEESYKFKKESTDFEKFKILETQHKKELEEENFQKEITNLIDEAEKRAREYEIAKKKAIREGKLLEKSPYLEIIQVYTNIRNRVVAKGWNKQALIYANQIKVYQEKLESDLKLRQIEQEKLLKQQEFEQLQKLEPKSEIGFLDLEKKKKIHEPSQFELEAEKFQKEIDEMINEAEKEAREYESAIKKGNFEQECPYLRIAELYKTITEKVHTRGWKLETEIYINQIKHYQERYESDIKLRQVEQEKILKQQEFEQLLKMEQKSDYYALELEKLMKAEEESQFEKEEELFEKEIDEMIDDAEKEVREYELAIKRSEFDKECPYLRIAEIYKIIREKVYARGWKAEADIYANQIKLYLEKFEKDKRLRELEAQKVIKQEEFEKILKIPQGVKVLEVEKFQKADEKISKDDLFLNKAMDLINSSENEVRSYELSLKKDILTYSSPYKQAIENYEEARKLFLKIGWKEEAKRLNSTISFYKDKKAKDDSLRELEKQKLEKVEKETIEFKAAEKQKPLSQDYSAMEYAKKKEKEIKQAEPIFVMINKAERLAQEYEIKKKDGILNIESPFNEIINLYQRARESFIKIGWNEQASQISDSLHFYQERSIADQNLRAFEKEKIINEQKAEKKRLLDAQLAKEAEEELQKQKVQAIELRKKQTMHYEMKKDEAFNIMDLAKKEFKQDNFDKAIKFYADCEKIFAEINWPEGIKMVKDSIKAIELRKERIEKEKTLIERKKLETLEIEAQIQDQIAKARDLKKDQEEQRKRELLELEKEKERERDISLEAYKLLEEGTSLKDKKKFEEAFEKYIMARDLFKKVDWQHEVSRINNDLLFILKKEMKQAEKIKTMLQKKEEEEKELEILLKEADERRLELEKIRKEEKRKQREQAIEEELEKANNVIKNLKYNEGIFMIIQLIKRLSKKKQEKLIKQLDDQIHVLENVSQVPIITITNVDIDEDMEQFKLGYQALDNAQISLSENLFMKAISELNEAKFNLKKTKIGRQFIPIIQEKINSYKLELGIEIEQEEEGPKFLEPKKDDLRMKIAERRAERKKRIKDILSR